MLRYEPHHVWDYRAEDLLTHPTFYPLAVLGAVANEQHRAEVLEATLQSAKQTGATFEDQSRTINIATTLAAIHLPTGTISTILERTNFMTTSLYEIYEDGVKERFQAEFVRIGRAEGLEQAVNKASKFFSLWPRRALELHSPPASSTHSRLQTCRSKNSPNSLCERTPAASSNTCSTMRSLTMVFDELPASA